MKPKQAAGADPSAEWEGRGRGYLNTASYGIPPRSAVEATSAWIDEWRAGSAPLSSWLRATEDARAAFARLTGLDAACVATGSSVSQLVGCVAASLPEGSRVLAEEREFTSLLFPFLAQADRGVTVELLRRDELPDAVSERGNAVAFSIVGSADGEVRGAEDLAGAARGRGALTIVDAAQACGWLDIDYAQFDFVVCPAFKWLCSPRGTAFLATHREHLRWVRPSAAGWWASEERSQFFGGPLRLADSARRLDISPVWNSWAGTAAALNTLESIGTSTVAERALQLANRLRAGIGRPPSDSPIVIVDWQAGAARLLASELAVSGAPGGARLAFHIYNDHADVDRVLEALHGR
jgi:selenocysteine lyase/cysteine desulfurase